MHIITMKKPTQQEANILALLAMGTASGVWHEDNEASEQNAGMGAKPDSGKDCH